MLRSTAQKLQRYEPFSRIPAEIIDMIAHHVQGGLILFAYAAGCRAALLALSNYTVGLIHSDVDVLEYAAALRGREYIESLVRTVADSSDDVYKPITIKICQRMGSDHLLFKYNLYILGEVSEIDDKYWTTQQVADFISTKSSKTVLGFMLSGSANTELHTLMFEKYGIFVGAICDPCLARDRIARGGYNWQSGCRNLEIFQALYDAADDQTREMAMNDYRSDIIARLLQSNTPQEICKCAVLAPMCDEEKIVFDVYNNVSEFPLLYDSWDTVEHAELYRALWYGYTTIGPEFAAKSMLHPNALIATKSINTWCTTFSDDLIYVFSQCACRRELTSLKLSMICLHVICQLERNKYEHIFIHWSEELLDSLMQIIGDLLSELAAREYRIKMLLSDFKMLSYACSKIAYSVALDDPQIKEYMYSCAAARFDIDFIASM